ncbi:hypothetical protein SAMN04488072_11364 [Lentibacillus halodurans]|uniref:Uncharacterized protein n=1 Tax=Lentibacillus halodurans TaxID=237679 RepID=A0A1I0ZTE3_9BACI|nr:hypothetical protein [Lentibacillus halodurans]SFB28935.1 hypothetical protein SAMN04488072_11364 [Lentibacillus halodurans]
MNENMIAKILFIIGVAQMAAGLIIGLIITTSNVYYGGAGWSIFFVWTVGGFVMGMLFIGFAENIRLLHLINQKIGSSKKKDTPKYSRKMEEPQVSWTLGEDEKAKIYDEYQGETIVEIAPSPQEDYCLVRFKSGHEYYVRVVYIGGYGVQETDDAAIKQSIIQWYNERD